MPFQFFDFALKKRKRKAYVYHSYPDCIVYFQQKYTMGDSLSENPDSNLLFDGFIRNLIAGGLAGTSVDVALFPIDTVRKVQ